MKFNVYFWISGDRSDFPEVRLLPESDEECFGPRPNPQQAGIISLTEAEIGAFIMRHPQYYIAVKVDTASIYIDTKLFEQI
jgi:hypothetical protein